VLLSAVRRHRPKKFQDLRVGKPVQYRTHVGGGYFISITTDCDFVDIRKFHMAEGQMQEEPSDEGIQLPLAEWDKIPGTIELAKSVFHGLQLQAKTCFDINHPSEPHHAPQCSECSPFCSILVYMTILFRRTTLRGVSALFKKNSRSYMIYGTYGTFSRRHGPKYNNVRLYLTLLCLCISVFIL